jgi:AcrR family transcriptional regulator
MDTLSVAARDDRGQEGKAMAQPVTETGRRGRGRPPRHSRERIVTAAVEELKRNPSATLTIKRVADAVGAAPMALYRYFPDRDALLQAVADEVLAAMERVPLPDGPWQDRLRTWMGACHACLCPYPELVPYFLTTTQQLTWLPGLLRLSDVLAPAGLDGEDLALAVTLVNTTVVGYVLHEGRRLPAEDVAERLTEALEEWPAPEAAALRPLVAGLPQAHARLYETILDQTVASVERLAAACEQP